MRKIILNGRLIDENKANISITDKGYFFDFAVYSSLKVIQGKIFFEKYHIDRLFESARLINLDHSFSKTSVRFWLNRLVKTEKIQDSLLRMILIGDPDGMGKEKLFIFSVSGLTYHPSKLYRLGAKVITCEGERQIPRSKTKNLLASFLAYTEAQKQGAIDALMVDKQGNIREGTRSNFFAIKKKTIIMPPAEKMLEGITKKIMLKVVRDHFSIKSADIPLKNINSYNEFFLTSTSMNVMPIRQIDKTVVCTNFEKTHVIANLLKEYYHNNILKEKQV